MVRSSLLAVVMLLAADCFASETNNGFDVSADGYVAAVEKRNDGYEMLTWRDGQEDRVALKRLDAVVDLPPNPEVAIGNESKFLAVRFSEGEMEPMVSFFETERLTEIRTIPAMAFAWSNDPIQVILVPSYDFDEGQKTGGLTVMNVSTGESKVIAQDLFFTGRIDARGDWIAGRTANYDEANLRHCFAAVNVKTNSVSEFNCQ